MARPNEANKITQAVLIADDAKSLLGPLDSMGLKSLLPLVGRPLIDYSLMQLESSPVQEVYVFASDPDQLVAQHIKDNWSGSHLDIKYVHCDGASCFGDFVRELDRRALIKNDFILITSDVVANVDLKEILQWHKKTKSRDKGSIMTSVYGPRLGEMVTDATTSVIVHSSEDKILVYNKKLFKSHEIKVPLTTVKQNMSVSVAKGLTDTGIHVCSPGMPILFTDNLDYNDMDDFIKGVIDNEDILQNSIYIYKLSGEYAARIFSSESYDEASRKITQRWLHPLSCMKKSFSANRCNTFIGKGVSISGSIVSKSSVIGDNCKIAPGCSIVESVIGPGCVLGSNVRLYRAYLFDSVVIDDNSRIDSSILANKVRIHKNSSLEKGCVVGSNVAIGPDVKLSGELLSSPGKGQSATNVGKSGSATVYVPPREFLQIRQWYSDKFVPPVESASESSDSEDSEGGYGFTEDEKNVQTFFNEVLENLRRGVIENISCDNIRLEINSMKHAYNIPIDEVTTLVIQAILHLPEVESPEAYSSELFAGIEKLFPVLKSYAKSESSQQVCLRAMEEYSCFKQHSNKLTGKCFVKLLKFLYDKDLIEEDLLVNWFDSLESLPSLIFTDAPVNKRQALRKEPLLVKFIEWLKEAEEEEEDEDEGDEDEDEDSE